MWTLKLIDANNADVPGRTYTVGRKNCDILIRDKAVSRKHAELLISLPSSIEQPTTTVSVKDQSKFGSYIDGTKFVGTQATAKSGSIIHFGVNTQLAFKLELDTTLVFCLSSSFDARTQTELQSQISALGGRVVKSIEECNYLVLEEFSFSMKQLQALIATKVFVTPRWVKSFLDRPRPESPLPKWSDYLPKLKPTHFVTTLEPKYLEPNAARQRLFIGKTFIFVDAGQYERAQDLIARAGGSAVKAYTEDDPSLIMQHQNDIFVRPSEQHTRGQRRTATDERLSRQLHQIEQLGIHLIGEEEIILAIFFCATDKYCCPLPPTKPSTPPPATTSASPSQPASSKSSPSMKTPSPPARRTDIIVLDDEVKASPHSPRAQPTTASPPATQPTPATPSKSAPAAVKLSATSVTPSIPSASRKRKREDEKTLILGDIQNDTPEHISTKESLSGMVNGAPTASKPLTVEPPSIPTRPSISTPTPPSNDVVKLPNFKRFRKSPVAGMLSPSLVQSASVVLPPPTTPMYIQCAAVARDPSNKPMEEWLQEALVEEKKRVREEREAEDLFNTRVKPLPAKQSRGSTAASRRKK